MAGSSEHVSFVDQSASIIRLTVKPKQYLILDLDASRPDAQIKPMVECVKFSPLEKALTMVEEVPMVHLSKSFSTSIYNKAEDVIHFEVANHKTSITKPHFSRLLGLTLTEVLVNQ